MLSTVQQTQDKRAQDSEWVMDSGASSHFSRDKQNFSKFSPCSTRSTASHITTAGGSQLPVTGASCINFQKNKRVSHVLYVPSLQSNLLSIGRFTDLGHNVLFNSKHCYVLQDWTPDFTPEQVHLEGDRHPVNRLYTLNQQTNTPTSSHLASRPDGPFAHSTDTQCLSTTVLWHKRLGHINQQRINHMINHNLATGMHAKTSPPHICDSCMKGKQARTTFPKMASTVTTRPLQLVHTNLCGPFLVPSLAKNRYFITFIDDFSRFSWVYFLQHKSEAILKFQLFRVVVQSQFEKLIACLRSDHGGEYLSTRFVRYCHVHGIQHQLTATQSPQQNGIAERKNRTLLEVAHNIVADTMLHAFLWEELIRSANYLQSRTFTHALTQTTPFEKS